MTHTFLHISAQICTHTTLSSAGFHACLLPLGMDRWRHHHDCGSTGLIRPTTPKCIQHARGGGDGFIDVHIISIILGWKVKVIEHQSTVRTHIWIFVLCTELYKYIYIYNPLVFFRVSQEFFFLFHTRNNKKQLPGFTSHLRETLSGTLVTCLWFLVFTTLGPGGPTIWRQS